MSSVTNIVYPSKKLMNRTAEDWKGVIEAMIDPAEIPKVASIVWWDHIDRSTSSLKTNDWFHKQLCDYRTTGRELTTEELHDRLTRIGYAKKEARKKRSFFDIEDSRMNSLEKKREKMKKEKENG
jgi:hypothetical protein